MCGTVDTLIVILGPSRKAHSTSHNHGRRHRGDGWDRSPANFSALNIIPMGVAWKEWTSNGPRPPPPQIVDPGHNGYLLLSCLFHPSDAQSGIFLTTFTLNSSTLLQHHRNRMSSACYGSDEVWDRKDGHLRHLVLSGLGLGQCSGVWA